MYICNDCGERFEEPDAKRLNDSMLEYAACPYCGDGDIEKVIVCPHCDEWVRESLVKYKFCSDCEEDLLERLDANFTTEEQNALVGLLT